MGGGLNLARWHIWRHLVGSVPPIEDLAFYSNFSICEIAQKSRFFRRDSVGGWPKMKEFWKNFDSTWSGNFSDQKSPFFQWENGSKWQKWPKHGMPKRSKKCQKCPKNALKCVKNVLKVVEAATVCQGKVRTCLQKVCMGVCEHGGTSSSEKYGFGRLCPFLSIFACFGAFWGPIWPFYPKLPKIPIWKRHFGRRKFFLTM